MFAWVVLAAACATAGVACASGAATVSVDEIVARIEGEQLRYVFVGERHGVGPAKRFVVDLVNRLVERGHDAALYVEGFRAGCDPRDAACGSLAWLFDDGEAFLTLLDRSLAPVHPLDPAERDRRAERMATTIAEGREAVRVVLVGNSHVLYAGDPKAEHWVYGGAVRYPDPGDVVEGFSRTDYLTLVLDAADGLEQPYLVREDGCRADYLLVAPPTGAY